ncbi:MAG: ABC transporter permease [Ignavibacteriales bacterium]|nr:ABC transporter permease [Ignavibacteriales bacterium]
MLIKIAWRNIWRNKRRTIIVLVSIVIGIAATIFMDGLSNGSLIQMLNNQINLNTSHIQIHKAGFLDDKIVQNYISNYKGAEKIIKKEKQIKGYSKRVISFGLISSATNSSGIFLNGIFPDDEKKVTIIHQCIIKGENLSGKLGEIIIGNELAKKLNVDVGDKIVTMVNSFQGDINSNAFRIVGIFQTPNSNFDNSTVFTNLKEAQEILEIGDNIHEIAILLDDSKNTNEIKQKIRANLSNDSEVLTFEELIPLLLMQIDMYKQFSWVISSFVAIALIFGIINIMLMAVYERVKEFGILISIGMSSKKIFSMLITESLSVGIIGTLVGVIAGLLILLPFSIYGIDLSIFAEGLQSWGIGTKIYPIPTLENTIFLLFIIPFVCILGAIYPAIKVIKLQPVNALKFV